MTAFPCFAMCGKPACVRLGCIRVYNERQPDEVVPDAPPSVRELLTAARVRLDAMMSEESERVGGDIAASREWFEMRTLNMELGRAESRAAMIERRLG